MKTNEMNFADFLEKQWNESVPYSKKIRDAVINLMEPIDIVDGEIFNRTPTDEEIYNYLMGIYTYCWNSDKGKRKVDGNCLFVFSRIQEGRKTRFRVNKEEVRKLKELCCALLDE